jgi:hypothetical protein
MRPRTMIAVLAAAGAVVLAALALAGCEDANQRNARHVVQDYLRGLPDDGGYESDGVHCTKAGRLFLDPLRTTRFVCTVRLAQGGDCDWFQVDARKDGSARVTLVRRRAGCVLPAG